MTQKIYFVVFLIIPSLSEVIEMGDLNLNPENTDHDWERAANQRQESRTRDHSQPIRRQDEEKDIDQRIRELEGV